MNSKQLCTISLLIVSCFLFNRVSAQSRVVTGKIISQDNELPLSGVSILVKGTSDGSNSSSDGTFKISVPDKSGVLLFSHVGYLQKEIKIGSSTYLSVSMESENKELSEVVVTALGIKKERASLGYSVTEVQGKELTQARTVNVLNSLEGKVAGLDVSSIAGGPGASSNVIIRGVSSLTQTNQPLYVINGIPVENEPNAVGSNQYANAPDLGDAISNLNPDDIESISVLKGASASALYGYRAKAGVILITTKTATGNNIELNSNYVAQQVIDPTNWQYEYGQGANNLAPTTQLVAFQSGQSSWGGKLDGSSVVQFDGVSRPYVAQKDNIKNFYRTGGTFTNTLAFDRKFDGGSIRLSGSDLNNQDIIPNSGLNRQTFNLSTNYNLTKHLLIDVRANYILEQTKNRPLLSDPSGNSNYNVMFLPTSVDVRTLDKTTNPDGSEFAYSPTVNATNPWFAARKFINNTTRDRLISSVMLRYNFDDGIFLQGRVGRDAYNDRYTSVVPTGTAYRPNGSMTDYTSSFSDLNADVLGGKTFKVTNDFSITPNVGASYRRTKSEEYINHGETFSVPFVYNILNAAVKTVNYIPSDEEVQSVYGTLELAYKDYLYVTGSGRDDWFSTLASPGENNKVDIFYPSVSGSFVFSQLLPSDWLSFGKLRAGYAVVGQATSPYQTQLSYTFAGSTFNGYPSGLILNSSVPNSTLKPSRATELEIGTELGLFQNRISLDLTWYNKKSTNEILEAPASIASGYGGAVLNIGELQNKGFEALISGYPIKNKNFSWKTSLNGSINDNKVLSLAAGQASLAVGTSGTAIGFIQDIVGLPANQIMAYDYKYDKDGKMLLDASGVPSRGTLTPFGSGYSKWIAGWNNDFSYKNFHLSFLIDGKFGGKIFSGTDYLGYSFGLDKATLVNREGTFGNNIDAATYYSTLGSNISKIFVLDASFIKFRQVIFGYTFPSKMFHKTIKGLSVSLVGRNLFYIMKKTDNIDPEADYTPNAFGLELGGVPPSRTYGVNVNFKF
ncbi:MAG: SusC/RagA family TonB-linked outer membrane protein [Ginsengibacter sp.]